MKAALPALWERGPHEQVSDPRRQHDPDERRHLRLQAAGLSDGPVLHRLPHPGGVRHRRPHHPDGQPAHPAWCPWTSRTTVFRFAAERRGGRAEAFSVGLRVIALGSAGTAAGHRPSAGRSRPIRAYGFLLASFVIASCCHALCAHFVRARGKHGPLCRPGALQHGPFHRAECAVPGGLSLGHPGLCALHHGGEPHHHGASRLPGNGCGVTRGLAPRRAPRGGRCCATASP